MSLRLSFNDLVNEAVNLEFQDYEKFVKQVSLLRSKKQVTGKQTKESALLEKINNGFPVEKWTQMQALDEKMELSRRKRNEGAYSLNGRVRAVHCSAVALDKKTGLAP